MPRRLVVTALSLCGLFAAGSASAAEGRFIHPADTDRDDRISREEWGAYKLPAAEFDKADTDGDGVINGPEFVAWSQTRN